jgi:hypothetical protein
MYHELHNSSSLHLDLMPSEDGQLTETFKGNKYLQTELNYKEDNWGDPVS